MTLEAHGDRANAAHARYLEIRRLLLIGRLDDGRTRRWPASIPARAAAGGARRCTSWSRPASRCAACARRARAPALARAARAAREASIPALTAEVDSAGARAARRPPRVSSRRARNGCCDSTRSRRCSARRRSSSTPAAIVVREAGTGDRARDAGRCCSRSPARWPRRGRRMSRARCWSRGPSAPRPPTNRIARACGSRSAGCAAVLRPLAGVECDEGRLRAGAAARPRGRRAGAAGRGSAMPTCWPSWPTASRGRARRSRWRSAPASAPCSARWRALAAAGKVQSFGQGRARRWVTPPVPGFTTTLLLPAPLPAD